MHALCPRGSDVKTDALSVERLAHLLNSLLELPGRVEELSDEIRQLQVSVEQMRRALPPALVSIPEAARALALSTATIRRRIKDGSLPSVRVGRSVRIDLSMVRPMDEDQVARLAAEARHPRF